MSIEVKGVERLTRKLDTMPQRTIDSAYDELEDIGEDLKAVSQARAPFRPGGGEHLRYQAYSTPTRGVNSASVEVGYDGPDDYLLVQHEGGWENFMGEYGPKRIEHYTTAGSGSKFLENPWTESLPANKRRVRDAVRRGLR